MFYAKINKMKDVSRRDGACPRPIPENGKTLNEQQIPSPVKDGMSVENKSFARKNPVRDDMSVEKQIVRPKESRQG
jgi:hypothetical protein